MTPERWQQLKQIFQSALERNPAERSAFLSQACADDPALRSQVESLIASHDQAGDSIEAMAADAATEMLDDDQAVSIVGKQISHYQVVSRIGRGGMGEVFLAQDASLGRKVALKLLRSDFTRNEERLRRFRQEARAASALNHPNILTIHEIGRDGSLHFMATEYVEGETLRQHISRARMTLGQALDVAVQVASALAAAHQAGIIHRDIKPENVMLRTDGYVKVLDFGLAKLAEPKAIDSVAPTLPQVETAPGVVMGTFSYMSPEQARGQSVDARTDIFSLAVVLYEMISGSAPFAGESAADVIAAILDKEPVSLSNHLPEVPSELMGIISKALRKDREDRYQVISDLLVGLKDLKRDLERAAETGSRTAESSPPTRRPYRIAGAAVLAILLVAALGVWTFVRRTQAENERKAAVAEMEHLVDVGRFVEAWRVGRAALQRWPGDPQLEHPMRVTTQPVTIVTDPPGAEVAFKAYEDVSGEWLPLGTTPLNAVPAPVGQLRWRITKAGFEPLEARLEVGAPAAAAGRPDVNAPPIRLRPVGSDVGRMVFVPGGNQEGVELTDYWIDQTEVTNREFKDFIDRGGYQDARHWAQLRRELTQLPGSEGAGAMFRDRTGRPGPSTWELGTYPEGKGDHPVNGVSWFEAVAYCQGNGKSLPTVFHWKKAFGASFFLEVLTLGNFAGQGPEATGQLKEVGPFGTYGMAGNVKEWVWNNFERRRYILGGAWNEPVYMAVYDDVRPPLDRAETHGFRCIKESTPSEATAYAQYGAGSRPVRDLTKEKPVDAATFEVFRRFYSYDRTSLEAKIERTEESEHWRRERVSFAAAYGGERVLVNILLPKNVAPPYQAVIWFPGAYALGLKSSERELVFSYYFDFLPRSGRALVYPVYKGTYERQVPGKLSGSQARDLVVQWSKDLGRTIDYLESRSDFDRNKLAYYGFSMGADSAVPIIALEPRLKAAILLSGGLVGPVRPPEVEPLNFVSRIKMPVLLLGGRNDFYFPVETSQVPLFKLLGTPAEHKRHVIFEGAGHVPPRIEVIRETLEWLDRYLGPVGR